MKYVIIWVAALSAIACGLLVCESHFLWKVQELDLFLHTSLFFKQQMVVPAGLLTYIGSWFTQFFYYPWMGVTMLCAWWLLLLFLLKQTFCVPARWASLLLIPVALLLLTDVDLGYWIYLLKLRGHFFLTTIATTMVVALLWGFRLLPDKYWLRAVWMALTCALPGLLRIRRLGQIAYREVRLRHLAAVALRKALQRLGLVVDDRPVHYLGQLLICLFEVVVVLVVGFGIVGLVGGAALREALRLDHYRVCAGLRVFQAEVHLGVGAVCVEDEDLDRLIDAPEIPELFKGAVERV